MVDASACLRPLVLKIQRGRWWPKFKSPCWSDCGLYLRDQRRRRLRDELHLSCLAGCETAVWAVRWSRLAGHFVSSQIIHSAELSRSLKVLDRIRNTPKSVRNRSESVCAGLWAPPLLGLVSSGVGGRYGPQIADIRQDP
jgi:hypothetical protein